MKNGYEYLIIIHETGVHKGVWEVIVWSCLVVDADGFVDAEVSDNFFLVKNEKFEYSIIKIWA